MTDRFLKELYARRGGIKLGIGRVASAFPQVLKKEIPLYHVAGTNGKGTVVYALAYILENSGYTTGRFISPHIMEFNERISVNGVDITDDEADELYHYLEKTVDDFDALSFFEITFLMAWKHFENRNCDRVVMEVGLGGKIDATNVISWPKTDIITSIGFDHMHILGNTLEKIAGEKLGIVKKGDVVIIGEDNDPVFTKWLRKEAFNSGAAEVTVIPEEDDNILTGQFNFNRIQKKNIQLAIAAIKKTEKRFLMPDLSDLEFPGRFQKIKDNVIIDVAHNPPAIQALAETISLTENRKVNFIYGSMRDKDINSVFRFLGDVAEKIFVVSVDEENRGAKVADVIEKADEFIKPFLFYADNDRETMEKAFDDSAKNGIPLVITGSFYTVEKFLRWYNEKNNF